MKEEPRILFLNRGILLSGGVSHSFLNFATHRDRSRVHVYVASLQKPSKVMESRFQEQSVPVFEIGENYLHASRRLRQLVEDLDIDVIVCGAFKPFLLASLATVDQRCNVVFWVPGITLMDGRIKRTTFRLLARTKTLVFVSKAVAQAHQYYWHRGDTQVLYHGVADHKIGENSEPSLRAIIGAEQSDLLVGYVAELTLVKNHHVLLGAFDRVAQRHQNIRLVLVGTGKIRGQVDSLAKSLNTRERIHLLGARTDVRDLLPQLDAYVHPSLSEGFGLAVAEAMLGEVPVAAARAGALPEFVLDDLTGLLFDPTDGSDVEATIERLINDSNLRRRLAIAGRNYGLLKFDPVRFAQAMTEILEKEASRT